MFLVYLLFIRFTTNILHLFLIGISAFRTTTITRTGSLMYITVMFQYVSTCILNCLLLWFSLRYFLSLFSTKYVSWFFFTSFFMILFKPCGLMLFIKVWVIYYLSLVELITIINILFDFGITLLLYMYYLSFMTIYILTYYRTFYVSSQPYSFHYRITLIVYIHQYLSILFYMNSFIIYWRFSIYLFISHVIFIFRATNTYYCCYPYIFCFIPSLVSLIYLTVSSRCELDFYYAIHGIIILIAIFLFFYLLKVGFPGLFFWI